MTERPRIALLGAGNLGRAILDRLLAAGHPAASVHVTTRTAEQATRLATSCPAVVGHDNARAVEGADVVILTVRPDQADDVLAEAGPALAGQAALVSFVAGRPLRRLPGAAFRVATNAVSVERGGLMAVTAAPSVPAEAGARVRRLLSGVGQVMEIPEDQQDLAASTLGSGAVFLALCGAGIANAAVAAGLRGDIAERFAGDALHSAAVLLSRSAGGEDRWRQLATPGGITEAGLSTIADARVPDLLAAAVRAAVRRAGELNFSVQSNGVS